MSCPNCGNQHSQESRAQALPAVEDQRRCETCKEWTRHLGIKGPCDTGDCGSAAYTVLLDGCYEDVAVTTPADHSCAAHKPKEPRP